MANIRVDLDYPISDGLPITFKAPCPCDEVEGLVVYYPAAVGSTSVLSKVFTFKDAHCNDVNGLNNLFTTNAYVKVVLNTTTLSAYIQNADTNVYLEGKFNGKENKAIYTSFILLASGWNGETYSLENTYPSATYDLSVEGLDGASSTQDQTDAYNNAMLQGSLNSNILYVKGDVPTIDIPIMLKVVVK